MNVQRGVCLSCRLRLLARLHSTRSRVALRADAQADQTTHWPLTTIAISTPPGTGLRQRIQRRFASTDVAAELPNNGFTIKRGSRPIQTPANADAEIIAFAARQHFGDRLPTGLLNEEEYSIYERNYGAPTGWDEMPLDSGEDDPQTTLRTAKEVLLKELTDGSFEEVIQTRDIVDEGDGVTSEVLPEEGESFTFDSAAFKQEGSWKDVQGALGAVPYERTPTYLALRDEPEAPVLRFGEDVEEPDGEDLRAHAFTRRNRFGTNPNTILTPKAQMREPVTQLLANLANKHLDDAAEKLLGGPGLPYGTGTPITSRTMKQKPIPLNAAQSKMTHMEADIFCSALMPGIYSAVTSVLVEVRRRLGSAWMQELMLKPEGPQVLDIGGAGAGITAWKEILKAEWARMHGDLPSSAAPEGKSTVVVGSPQLLHRSSRMLDNTQFLPRLPDYVHAVFHSGAQRKQFDIIIAPHTLWNEMGHDARNLHLDKLWSLLNPEGGIIVLLEKGVPRGFEAVADAREYLINKYIEQRSDLPVQISDGTTAELSGEENAGRLDGGAIIAPCTTHGICPMYPVAGLSQRRKDYCHFSQRFLRPAYYQRMLGAKSRNHEDVHFSYVTVQRGVRAGDLKPRNSARDSMLGLDFQERTLGEYATERAFEGFSLDDPDVARPLHHLERSSESVDAQVPPPHVTPNPFSLPRVLSTPLKRRGHVIFDVCTPSATLQRWTVAKSYGKQAYRDARKLRWGDLWALGAATRIPKSVRLGLLGPKAASQRPEEQQEEDEEDEEENAELDDDDKPKPNFGKGKRAGRGRSSRKKQYKLDREKTRTGLLAEQLERL